MANKSLNNAKVAKNDEFYTRLADIEKELNHYRDQFRGKVVYCNCDDARESNFFKYFSMNFEFLGLGKLICTGYKEGGHGVILIYEGDRNSNKTVDNKEIVITELEGDGDFRSNECIGYLKQADVVVTNPPFSMFREYLKYLFDYSKKFIIIGNKNAVKYKEIIPYIKDGKLWCGYTIPNDFYLPNGSKTGTVNGLCRWFTNLETDKAANPTPIFRKFNKTDYPKYDNYDAYEVSKIADMPVDIPIGGVVGVPITVVDKIASDGLIYFDGNTTQIYKNIGVFNNFNPETADKESGQIYGNVVHIYSVKSLYRGPVINGEAKYARILIQRIK